MPEQDHDVAAAAADEDTLKPAAAAEEQERSRSGGDFVAANLKDLARVMETEQPSQLLQWQRSRISHPLTVNKEVITTRRNRPRKTKPDTRHDPREHNRVPEPYEN
jgi:hypothetical protein